MTGDGTAPLVLWPPTVTPAAAGHRRAAELHLYDAGGHEFGMAQQKPKVNSWTDRLEEWLATRGYISPDVS